MIEWIFFDVGNVMFNDDPQNYTAYRVAHRRLEQHRANYSFADMLAERESLAREGDDWILNKLLTRLVSREQAAAILAEIRDQLIPAYDRNHLVNDGLPDVLQLLRRQYRLGVIANQPEECRQSLIRRELHELFDVVAISEELNLHKPDVRLYEWAVNQAQCDPRSAVMIGDRVDNDVAPARELSMRTILVKWPHSGQKNWRPSDPDAKLFLDSCDRTSLFDTAVGILEADRTIPSLREVPEAVASLDAIRPE